MADIDQIPPIGAENDTTGERPQTPSLHTPPGSKTPPTVTTKRVHSIAGIRATSASVDADALSRRLKEFESAGRPRDRTPGRSPSRKRQRVYGDR